MSEMSAQDSATTLSVFERRDLNRLETIVELGRQTFIEVGIALAEIRDSRLYRETHSTFEAYCRDRWQWSRPRVYQFIQSAEAAGNLSTTVDIPAPTSERQIRPLTRLGKEKAREAWCRAHEIAEEEGKPVTGKIVEIAVNEITGSSVGLAACETVAAESHADKAIAWISEIDITRPGAKFAIKKVITYCKKLMKEINHV